MTDFKHSFWIFCILTGVTVATVHATTSQVDQGAVCIECHSEIADQMTSKVDHPPASSADCSACHNPHAGRNEMLLLDRPAVLCVECHSSVTTSLNKAEVHRPVAEGRCSSCHEVHGGDHKALLLHEGTRLCVECHSQVETWSQRPVLHSPFARESCQTCHAPHGADFPALAPASESRLCMSCHSATETFKARHRNYPVQIASCNQCHDPHASERRGLFRETVHEPFASGTCSTCHATADANDPFRVIQQQSDLCGSCHPDQIEEVRQAPFPHAAGGGSGCTGCHNAHAGSGDAMLHAEQVEVCLSCHDPGGAKSGQPGRYVSHGPDLSCGICHTAHGGDRPLLLSNDSIELCGECHAHQHQVTHPMGEGAPDPRTGQPMDCLSCHGIHDAPAKKYLHSGGERELCIACHSDLARNSQ